MHSARAWPAHSATCVGVRKRAAPVRRGSSIRSNPNWIQARIDRAGSDNDDTFSGVRRLPHVPGSPRVRSLRRSKANGKAVTSFVFERGCKRCPCRCLQNETNQANSGR